MSLSLFALLTVTLVCQAVPLHPEADDHALEVRDSGQPFTTDIDGWCTEPDYGSADEVLAVWEGTYLLSFDGGTVSHEALACT